MSGTMRVVVDTDAGVDDAVAVMMALHAFPADVAAVTTVFGNVDLHQADHNVAHILEALGRTDVPVHSGARRPIVASVTDEKWEGHGPDGLGGEAGLAAAEQRVARRNDAVHALIELSQAHAGELVVIAIGPLTNVALAMLLEPAFARNLRRLVVMGGLSRGEGNSTPHAEFNVACDPEATHIVYEHCSADQLVVVPFETCADNTLSWETFDRVFCNENKPTSAYIRKIWRFNRSFSPEGFLPCDAYAVAVLLHDRYVTKSKRVRGAIHLAHDERRGACVWQEDCTPKDANATLVTEVDKAVFVQLLENLAA